MWPWLGLTISDDTAMHYVSSFVRSRVRRRVCTQIRHGQGRSLLSTMLLETTNCCGMAAAAARTAA